MAIISPRDGDMLTGAVGANGAMRTRVEVDCEAGREVLINGARAEWVDGKYEAEIALCGYESAIRAACGAETAEIKVYCLKNASGRYSLSLDDNIWALAEISGARHASIFDNPYFALYRRAHERYGAKVRMNLFYRLDNPHGLAKYGAFDLSQMTDRHKSELQDNADWLRFAFHAQSEFPDRPYKFASYAEVERDCARVQDEICRFAGEKALESATTAHWGELSPEGVAAVRAAGVTCLMGYMEVDERGEGLVSYNLGADERARIDRHGFIMKRDEDMAYGKISAVLNLMTPAEATALLSRALEQYPERGFIEIMIHEQYFHRAYPAYMADFEERVMNGCRFCAERGLTGAFVSEALRKG